MAIPQEGSLPPFFVLESGYIVRLTALDPVSGAVVSGVVISNGSIDVDNVNDATPSLTLPSTVSGAYLAAAEA
jgi:hypothetical protein